MNMQKAALNRPRVPRIVTILGTSRLPMVGYSLFSSSGWKLNKKALHLSSSLPQIACMLQMTRYDSTQPISDTSFMHLTHGLSSHFSLFQIRCVSRTPINTADGPFFPGNCQ